MGNEINLIQVEQFIKNFKSENSKEVITITTYPNKPVDITSSKFGGIFLLYQKILKSLQIMKMNN